MIQLVKYVKATSVLETDAWGSAWGARLSFPTPFEQSESGKQTEDKNNTNL